MDRTAIKPEPGTRDNDRNDLRMADARPSYKSWKKKYRKMRIKFDHQMHEIESLHKLEQKAMRTAKRLAIENDRLMDMLMDINESPQIPYERRIDLGLGADAEEEDEDSDATQQPIKSFKKLEQDVPHDTFAEAVAKFPDIRDDLEPKDPEIHPTSFLTGADVDEYLHELDQHLGLRSRPSLAPSAQGTQRPSPAANFALRNPTSVYNWLRKHAPKTFLQDLEKEKDKDKDKHDKHHHKDVDDHHSEKGDGPKKRKPAATRTTKRQSAASRKEKEAAEAMDNWDDDVGYEAPATTSAVKGKRKRDDDPGYRPKGGSSRPSKKRKSKDLPIPITKARKSIT
ncbi:IEC3 subunit of the Ino80 complex, chromatin re-modelling-domain-containing protein [Whalleya microplaca]|nr:IEC3 subunit of the Ino80 complex, chromatin re-modelling-domain-containing protein [Whalleya microplaca]